LSTFHALASRTGPFKKHIVFTNCKFIRYMGRKSSLDYSICLNSLKSITLSQWMSMVQVSPSSSITQEPVKMISDNELREARLKYFMVKSTQP